VGAVVEPGAVQDAVNNDEPPLAINNHEPDAVNNDEQDDVDNTMGDNTMRKESQ